MINYGTTPASTPSTELSPCIAPAEDITRVTAHIVARECPIAASCRALGNSWHCEHRRLAMRLRNRLVLGAFVKEGLAVSPVSASVWA